MENQPTKLDKFIKVSIILGILVVALSVAYYLVIFLPKKEQNRIEALKNEDIENKRDNCIKLGLQKQEAEQKDLESAGKGTYGIPVYKYNEKIDACLYKNLYIDGKYFGRYVIDLYSNEEVVSSDKMDGKAIGTSDEEYERRVSELFN